MGDEVQEAYERDERWQLETREFSERLLAVAEASPRYAGAELRSATQELVIFTVGGPTEKAIALAAEAPSTIRVNWQEAPYTLNELTAEARRLVTQHPARLNSAGPITGGTGVRVTTTNTELLAADDPTEMLGARFPVRVDYGEPAMAM